MSDHTTPPDDSRAFHQDAAHAQELEAREAAMQAALDAGDEELAERHRLDLEEARRHYGL